MRNSKELHPCINYRIGVPPYTCALMYNYLNKRKMKATSKTINATYVQMDWESMREYNEEKNTFRCRVTFSEVSKTDEGETNTALAFLQSVTSGNMYSIVVNLDSDQFGKDEDEKSETFESAMKDENGKLIPIPLTIVSVALDKTYYTETGLPVDMRKIAYIGTDDHEEQAIASVTRRLNKQIEDEELFESDPTKEKVEEKKGKRR